MEFTTTFYAYNISVVLNSQNIYIKCVDETTSTEFETYYEKDSNLTMFSYDDIYKIIINSLKKENKSYVNILNDAMDDTVTMYCSTNYCYCSVTFTIVLKEKEQQNILDKDTLLEKYNKLENELQKVKKQLDQFKK
jgi:hypothetical protein